MKTFLNLCTDLAWGIQCVLLIYAIYNVILALPFFRKDKPMKHFAPQKRFAVLVAARNEESVIGSLVESLLAQDYPKELFDVYVIPNNCSDDTAEAARRAGAWILTCTAPVKCKGDALSFAFDYFEKKGNPYDAFCIFDADNLVDRNFLRSMNDAFCSGAKAAQGRRDSKNPYDSPLTGSYSIYYWMISRFYNHPRSLWNLSAVINGCGFAVSAGLLKELGGFHTKTLTEDLEFTTQCILRDQKVAWVPEAVFYDESPLQFSPSWKQRRRWSAGVFQCLRLYGPRLLGKLIRERKLLCLDQFLFLTAPLMQILSLVPAALAVLLFLLSPGRPLQPSSCPYFSPFSGVPCSPSPLPFWAGASSSFWRNGPSESSGKPSSITGSFWPAGSPSTWFASSAAPPPGRRSSTPAASPSGRSPPPNDTQRPAAKTADCPFRCSS